MGVALPRVLVDGEYSRRLHPIACSVTRALQPLSTANMVLPPMDEINSLDWVAIETPDGETEYFQVVSIATDTTTGEKTVYLEHGACTLDDILIQESSGRKPLSKKDTITNVLAFLLEGQNRWTVGTVESTDTIYIEPGGSSIMTAILTMMDSIPDYQVEFVQASESNWHVDVKARPSTAICEGRLSRNLESCEIAYSSDEICTRVYAEGLTGGKMDSLNIPYYGLHEETMSINKALSQAQKERIAQAYLDKHDHPSVSISISGVELSQITGLPIDKFLLGTVCRIVIPWLGIVENEVIVEKSYTDVYNNPEAVEFSLANAAPDLSIAVAKVTGGGGGGGGSGQEAIKKRFETRFIQTDEYFQLIATDTEWDELENGTVTAYAQLVITSASIESVVEDIAGSGYSSITQLAAEVDIKVAEGDVATQLSVECGNVTISGGNLKVDGYVEADASYAGTLYGSKVSVTGDIAGGGTVSGTNATFSSGTGTFNKVDTNSLTVGVYGASWKSQTVVTGVSSRTGSHSFALSTNGTSITSTMTANPITGLNTTTIYYLGR